MRDGYLNTCKICKNKYVKEWVNSNREARKKIAREYSARNRKPELAAKWWKENPHKAMEYHRAKNKRMPGYSNAISASRRAKKLKATPKWANSFYIYLKLTDLLN